MLFYTACAAFVFAIAFQSAVHHGQGLPSDAETWFFILLIALIWPLTLPSILLKKAQRAVARLQRRTSGQAQTA